jgi:hypothetical protein
VENIAKELVGAKYIELLNIITWIRREAYAVLIAYRGARPARETPTALRLGICGGVGQRRRHLEGLKHAEVAEAVEKC